MDPFEHLSDMELAALYDGFETLEEDGHHTLPENQDVANSLRAMFIASMECRGLDPDSLHRKSIYSEEKGFEFH